MVGFKWMNITRCRSSPFDNTKLGTEWFFRLFYSWMRNLRCKKRPKKHWFDFIYAACFISSQFVSSMQAKCIVKWDWEQRKNNNLTVCLHASIGNERNNNSASMCQQPKTNRQINNETLNNKSNWGVVNWCAAAVAVCKSTWSYLHTHTHGVFHSIQAMKLCDLVCFAAIFFCGYRFFCRHTYSAFGNIRCIVFVDTKNWKFIKYDNVNIENRSAHIVRILFIREKNDNNHNDCECLCLEIIFSNIPMMFKYLFLHWSGRRGFFSASTVLDRCFNEW